MNVDLLSSSQMLCTGTAFAYGQTSSGKTFTMNGSETDVGVIPRAVRDIFATIETVGLVLSTRLFQFVQVCGYLCNFDVWFDAWFNQFGASDV